MESMVDFVLNTGHHNKNVFSDPGHQDHNSSHFNQRKLLSHLFQNNITSTTYQQRKRVSDLKYEEISGQLNYFSEKLHVQLSKKHIELDSDLQKLEEMWMRKKIPDFYSYYFLKFAYANTYSRMQELFLSEIQHMRREKDSYIVIKKTIEARQICIANLRRQIASISDLEIEESLEILRKQMAVRKRKEKENKGIKQTEKKKKKNDDQGGVNWKNKLEIIFETISHLRKLTGFVVELIKNWKNSIINISEDPRRFRERVIFFYNEENYLIKSVYDSKFVFKSFLQKYLDFANHYDPFFLRPLMILENKQADLSDDEEVFLQMLKPTDQERQKMVRALMVLAEEEYDEDEQSKLLEQKKDNTALEKRKKFFQKRRDVLLAKSTSNLDKEQRMQKTVQKEKKTIQKEKKTTQTHQNNNDKEKSRKKQKIEESINKMRKIRSVDMKKISPYLSRNDKLAKAQKVLQLQHKFKVAQDEYVDMAKKKKQDVKGKREQIKKQWKAPEKEASNNRIFNRYIEQNLKLMDQANKKAFLYKNKVAPKKNQAVRQNMDYNMISYRDRKQAEYQRNLEQYQRQKQLSSRQGSLQKNNSYNHNRKGVNRGVIEISNKGIKSNQNIIDYELTGRKGKNVGTILNSAQKAQQMKMIENKMNSLTKFDLKQEQNRQRQQNILQEEQLAKSRMTNLFQTQQRPQIVVMRQQPQKIQQLKQFLYIKIKEQLLQEMKKNKIEKQQELSTLIEEEKRKRLNEIIEQRKLDQIKMKEEEERVKLMELDMQRKKLDFQIKVQAIQFSEENVTQYFDKMFSASPQMYHRLFLNEKVEEKKQFLMDSLYLMFLRGFLDDHQVTNCIIRYDWKHQSSRKLVIQYLTVEHYYHFMSSFHHFSEYIWKNDPADHIEIIILNNAENHDGAKFIQDLQQYASHQGEIFQKVLYSNVKEMKFVFPRPQFYKNIAFEDQKYYFGKNIALKSQLLITSLSMNQRESPKIQMNLEVFTNYVFLLQELFRKYLTPQEIQELRQNSTNIRRLKDIFRIILQLDQSNPVVDEITIVEGLNLDDLYEKMKEKKKPPYDRYYWHHFYDKTLANRILLAILQFKLEVEFPVNSCFLNDRRFLRINPRRKILTLRSSIYSQDNIYIINTNQPKIRMFFLNAEHFKIVRIELFVFLNLVFNNIVEDTEIYVNSFWIPQFIVNSDNSKQVKRITDFSITMKKSFFLSEDIYFSNREYIKNGISMLPKKSDVIYKDSMIVGFLHTAVESASRGMPSYAKMIDVNTSY